MKKSSILRPVTAASAIAAGIFAASCGGVSVPTFGTTCGLDFKSPNYAADTDQSTGKANTLRWWDEFPVSVWFGSSATYDPSGANINSTDVITAGIVRWVTATGGRLQLSEASSEDSADITIDVVILSSKPSTLATTIATVVTSTGRVTKGRITLYVWNGMSQQEFAEGFKATAGHEMGHALYLGGHSNQSADLMYFSKPSNVDKNVSTRDFNTLETAYCGLYITRSPASREEGPTHDETICRLPDGGTESPSDSGKVIVSG
jgi:hypothetical protein